MADMFESAPASRGAGGVAPTPAAMQAAGALSPSIVFGEGHRPEAAIRIQFEAFDGPLALLLSLIEGEQLDVLTVPLGALADAYLDALATLDGDRLGNISAFVAVASQLILIKSRAMLPSHPRAAALAIDLDEEPDPEAELRARLVLYRAYRDGGARLAARTLEWAGLFRREPGVATAAGLAGADPEQGPPLDPAALAAALAGVARLAPPPSPPAEMIARTVTLAERAAIIRLALEGADSIVLQDLLHDVHDRVVVAVTFVAMLELVKRREIVVEQAVPFGPIVARRRTAQERATASLDSGFPGESVPLDEDLESFR
jgi:segregation and condensation protein A